jgi:hypothetical protein
MTILPTLAITEDRQARILDAYKARFGTTTTAETARACRRWLAGGVRAVIEAYEAQQIDEANNATKRNALAALRATLPDPDTTT